MIIILDSNVWVAQLGLTSPKSAVLMFRLLQNDAKIAVPDVVRSEVEENLSALLIQEKERVLDLHQRMLSVFGVLKAVVLPSDEEIHDKSTKIFEREGVEIDVLPFSPESARLATDRLIKKKPPCDRKEEFRDAVIWEECLRLLSNSHVYLVTKDKAFYEGHDFKKGLSGILKKETFDKSYEVSIFYEFSELLKELEKEVDIDWERIASHAVEERGDAIQRLLERHDLSRSGLREFKSKIFATEDAKRIAVSFTCSYRCRSELNEERDDAWLEVSGKVTFNWIGGVVENFVPLGEALYWKNQAGETQKQNIIVGTISMVLGHRDVFHSVEALLQEFNVTPVKQLNDR